MPEGAAKELVRRLENLERGELRLSQRVSSLRWGVGLVVVGLGASLLLGGAAATAPPRTLEARQFILRDKTGKYRGEFSAVDEGNAAGLQVCGADSRPQTALSARGEGTCALVLKSSKTRAELAASLAPAGALGLAARDEAHHPRFSVSASESNGTHLSLSDAARRGVIDISARPGGRSSIALRDMKEYSGIFLMLYPSEFTQTLAGSPGPQLLLGSEVQTCSFTPLGLRTDVPQKR